MSNKVGQKEAVVSAVKEVLGGDFQPGTNVNKVLTRKLRNEVREKVFSEIMEGNVVYSKNTEDEKEVKKYVNGMVDNHIRKAKELNGGVRYSAKNPGSGRGRKDPQLVNLKRLQTNYSKSSPEYAKVQEAIVKREKELVQLRSAKKNNKVLPPELSHLAE